MNRITDARLDEVIAANEDYCAYQQISEIDVDTTAALQELRDCRKAVREYLGFVDEWEKDNSHLEPDERAALDRACRRDLEAAEAALRALAQEGKT